MVSLKRDVQDIAPVRSTEICDAASCESTVWRQPGESMANCATRRREEFGELKEVSADATVSEDSRATLVLRFPGVGTKEQAAVLASNSDQWPISGAPRRAARPRRRARGGPATRGPAVARRRGAAVNEPTNCGCAFLDPAARCLGPTWSSTRSSSVSRPRGKGPWCCAQAASGGPPAAWGGDSRAPPARRRSGSDRPPGGWPRGPRSARPARRAGRRALAAAPTGGFAGSRRARASPGRAPGRRQRTGRRVLVISTGAAPSSSS